MGFTSPAQMNRVRLFRVALDGSNSDHLTNRKCRRDGGSGLGTALSA